MKPVSEKLKDLIAAKGITYSFIASQTGIKLDAISRSLMGKRRLTADEMLRICRCVNIDLCNLIDDVCEHKPE